MPSQVAAADTPPRTLREAIARSHLTTAQVIAKAGCSRKSLTNWRSGQRPSDYYIGILGKVLGVDLWPIYESTNESIKAESMPLTVGNPIARTTPVASYPQLDLARSVAQHIDMAAQSYLAGQLNRLWDQFHLAEEPESIALVRIATASHLHTLESLTAWKLSDLQRQWLLQSLCEAAILIGRIARDQLNYEEAIAYHKHALRLALESQSGNHITAATMRLTETLWDAGLPYEAWGYCDAGLEYGRQGNARIHGELLGFASMLQGKMGSLKASESLANQAAELAVGAVTLATAGGINFSEVAAASYLSGHALRAGNIEQALLHIERGRVLLPVEFPHQSNARWEAHLWINQAKVHGAAGDLDTASSALLQATRLASSISSRIGLRKVQEVAHSLNGMHSAPHSGLRALHEEIVSLTLSRISQ